ncbi:MAG: D-alanyl-D-alanine carboxypeptidase [Eubacteriales bacterium]|nr:D-alanyl-D-alanine carboxypeptidase [Eubacteriales bacterium]
MAARIRRVSAFILLILTFSSMTFGGAANRAVFGGAERSFYLGLSHAENAGTGGQTAVSPPVSGQNSGSSAVSNSESSAASSGTNTSNSGTNASNSGSSTTGSGSSAANSGNNAAASGSTASNSGSSASASGSSETDQSNAGTASESDAASKDTGNVEVQAQGAVAYCENTGETVLSKNADGKFQPYSLTKLLTVLIAVNRLSLDEEVTVSADAASQTGSSVGLKEGEKVSVKDLIYGALLPSGNDAAYALGEAVSGNMASFVKLMNKTASNIGCTNTHFMNATGMYDEGQYTTCSDFLNIVRQAFSNRTVEKAAGTKTYTIQKTNKSAARKLKTKVSLLKKKDSGIAAGKTGYGNDNDASIAAEYNKDGMTLYIILLGDKSASRTEDVQKISAYAMKTVKGVLAVKKGSVQGTVHVRRGEKTKAKVYAASDGYAYLPKEGSKKLIKTKIVYNDNVEAPLHRGSVVGTCEIYLGGTKVNSVPLVVQEEIPTGWLPSYVGISNMATVVILLILAVILLLFVIVLALRARNRRIRKRKKERLIRTKALEKMMEEEEHKKRGWDF